MMSYTFGAAFFGTLSGIIISKWLHKYRPVIWFGWVSPLVRSYRKNESQCSCSRSPWL